MSYIHGDELRREEVLVLMREARLCAEAGKFVECGELIARGARIAQHDMGDKRDYEEAAAAIEQTRADALAEQEERVR